MEISEISIVIVLLLVLVLFAFLGFVKGLLKTGLGLVTLAGGGFAAWWGYHYVPSKLSEYWEGIPSFMNIVCAAVIGALVFFVLHRLCHFIINPFDAKKGDSKTGWNFGLPAAMISLFLALVVVCLGLNRMRETDQINQMREIMTHGVVKHERSGVHKFVIEEVGQSSLGAFVFSIDPLWDEKRAKLATLLVMFFKVGSEAVADNKEALALMNSVEFHRWAMSDKKALEALRRKDAAGLWNAELLDQGLENPDIVEKLEGLEL